MQWRMILSQLSGIRLQENEHEKQTDAFISHKWVLPSGNLVSMYIDISFTFTHLKTG